MLYEHGKNKSTRRDVRPVGTCLPSTDNLIDPWQLYDRPLRAVVSANLWNTEMGLKSGLFSNTPQPVRSTIIM